MGNRNTAWGTRAYKEVRKNGGSKEEAKQVAKSESEKYWEKEKEERENYWERQERRYRKLTNNK